MANTKIKNIRWAILKYKIIDVKMFNTRKIRIVDVR